MSAADVDAWLAGVDEPRRGTLEQLRRTILDLLPDAEQGIAYGGPAFKVAGKAVAGFAAHANDLSYLPHSGTVLTDLGDEVADYETSKGALRFPIDTPLPADLVARLIEARLDELGLDHSQRH